MRNLNLGIVAWILVCLGIGVSFADSWQIYTVDPDGGSGSLALDALDHACISYSGSYYGGVGLKYAYWTGTEWQIQTIDAGISAAPSSLALDSNQYPHISYYDYELLDRNLKYAYWNGITWEIETIDSGGYVGSYNTLALDSQDYPHITYYDEVNSDLKYIYWTGSEWIKYTVDHDGNTGTSPSIALNSLGMPCIAYEGSNCLKYAVWTGTGWDIQIADPDEHTGGGVSLALDNQDYPHISYMKAYPDGHQVEYCQWTGSEWNIEYVDSIIDYYEQEETSIALDAEEHPRISYDLRFYDSVHHQYNSTMKYAEWTGSQWEVQIVDSSGYPGLVNSLALDSTEHPHISYHNGGLIYARYGEPYIAIALLSLNASSLSNGNINITWNVDITDLEPSPAFNLYRRNITPAEDVSSASINCSAEWQKVNSSLISGKNPFTFIDSAVEEEQAYEYRLEVVVEDTAQTMGICQVVCSKPSSFAITSVYPNPAQDKVILKFSVPVSGTLTVAIYDISGRKILAESLGEITPDEPRKTLDVSSLSSGLYIIQANLNGLSDWKRIIVAR